MAVSRDRRGRHRNVKGTPPKNLPATIARTRTMELLSRLGYIVHGAIYMFIGVLAARLAWGLRGNLADPPSAIQLIDQLPYGHVMVSAIAVGLIAYSLWRFVQAVADPDCQGRSLKGIVVRIGRGVSGIGYAALAVFASRLAVGTAGDGRSQNWAYKLLSEPLGPLAGAILAIILIGVASDDVRKACTTNFGERLNVREMNAALTAVSRYAGVWGFAARAVVLVFGGAYLIWAVFTEEPHRAQGFEGILASFLLLPYGDWILLFVALGMAAYGLFMVQAGLYRRHPF